MSFLKRRGEWKIAAVLGAALAIAACAKNPAEEPNALAGVNAGAATPGSPRDFAVNVGDRVFFDSDSSELSPTAQATLDKQARWLQQYARYNFTVEGTRGRARHARIQLRSRRPPGRGRQAISRRARHIRRAHSHDQLRQGTARRRLQRYFLLVAEPARRHGASGDAVVGSFPSRDFNTGARLPVCDPVSRPPTPLN